MLKKMLSLILQLFTFRPLYLTLGRPVPVTSDLIWQNNEHGTWLPCRSTLL